jgi:hypothetical protein
MYRLAACRTADWPSRRHTQESVELAHVIQRGFGGMNDDQWIPLIAREHWVIITADRGSRPKPGTGANLASVCREHRVTYVALSRSINKGNSFAKLRAIMAVWEGLLALKDVAPGSGFSIRPNHAGNPVLACTFEHPGDPSPDTHEADFPLGE